MLQKYDDRVDDYLKGNLSEQEMDTLNKEHPELLEEIEFRKNTTQAFAQNRFSELKQKLQLLNEEKDIVEIKPVNTKKWWIAAASLALLITVGTLIYINHQAVNSQSLFSEYYEPYPNLVLPIEREVANFNNEKEAFLFYEQEDFENAYLSFEKLQLRENTSDEIYFYQGISALSSKYINSAEEIFQKYISLPDVKFKIQAEWYLALYYIRNEEFSKSLELLKSIRDNGTYKHQEAQLLIKELE